MRKSYWQALFLIFLIVGTLFILGRREPYRNDKGTIFGTLYNITYQSKESLREDIEKELKRVDASLSPFNDTSIISRINRNETVRPDSLFLCVFNLAGEISGSTEGAFDITVAPLVNAWGFGFKSVQNIDSALIDSLRELVDFRKVTCRNGEIVKEDPRIMLDCSAIAKGFGSDVVARYLDGKGIANYMVEIGGEVVVRGKNDQDKAWKIGIVKPQEDSIKTDTPLQSIVSITDAAMATSGNYRNFYYKDGKKYAHTIDPQSGYPVQHSLLSATVFASDCARADALATAFMVMGMERAIAYCKEHPEVEAYFIYADETGAIKTASCTREKYLSTGK